MTANLCTWNRSSKTHPCHSSLPFLQKESLQLTLDKMLVNLEIWNLIHNEVLSHSPHICRGQGRYPGKFSHSSGSSPGGVESIKKLTCAAQKWNPRKGPTPITTIFITISIVILTRDAVESVGQPRWVAAISWACSSGVESKAQPGLYFQIERSPTWFRGWLSNY